MSHDCLSVKFQGQDSCGIQQRFNFAIKRCMSLIDSKTCYSYIEDASVQVFTASPVSGIRFLCRNFRGLEYRIWLQ